MKFPIDHDLHVHTSLSACCFDEGMTAEYICGFARRQGYSTLCFTDHFWDANVPGASGWYQPQDFEHVKRLLPLPETAGVKVMFGCETEFCGGEKLGVAPARYDAFDMIVVPVNHFHMRGFVRPENCETDEALAVLLMERMEELLALALPWKKVGLAHLNCGFNGIRTLTLLPEARLRAAFRRFAACGAGIELNASSFGTGWLDSGNGSLQLFRAALEEGCKFYCGSDAHARKDLNRVPERLREAADRIGLTAGDLFVPK